MQPAIATIFPSAGLRLLSNIVHYAGVTVCAYCFARRSSSDKLWTLRGWTSLTLAKVCVLAIFIDSWLFLTFTGILINGVGLSENIVACELAIYSCVFAYGVSKIFIYFFLIEKVHIVWRTTTAHVQRLQSPVYRFCLAVMLPYLGVFIAMVVGRVAFKRADGICVIGLRSYASLPLIAYDLFINVFLTGMFLWPIFHTRFSNPRLKAVARRTLIAAVTGLTTSCVNIGLLTLHHGQELGWVCLASCGTDVVVNAVVIYWVTGSAAASSPGTMLTLDKTAAERFGAATRRGSAPQTPCAAYMPPSGRRESLMTADAGAHRRASLATKSLFGTMSCMLSAESTRTDEKDLTVHVNVVQETHSEERLGDEFDEDVTLHPIDQFENDATKGADLV